MFISIGVVFFVLPILVLILAFFTQFTSTADETTETVTATGDSDTSTIDPTTDADKVGRLLQNNGITFATEPENNGISGEETGATPSSNSQDEPLNIIRWWTFMSLIAIISFSFTELTPVMLKLYK